MLRKCCLSIALITVFTAAPLALQAAEHDAAMRYLDQGTYEGVPYLSGGIGLMERRYLESVLEPNYNLKLEFAEANGDYLAEISVKITDQGGNRVLEVDSAGPWLLARLPSGEYRIQATTQGRTLTKTVTVGDGSPRVVFKDW